jgi:predicted ATPase
MLTKLTLGGFKSFRKLELELRPLNVLIGANGAGKSNLISFFRFLNAIVNKRLQNTVSIAGGADVFLRFGKKQTKAIFFKLELAEDFYFAVLRPDQNDSLRISPEAFYAPTSWDSDAQGLFGDESEFFREARLEANFELKSIYEKLTQIRIYHIPDTSSTAAIKGYGRLHDNFELRSDGENLAAMLYLIQTRTPKIYQMIRDVIRSVAPYFDDFLLEPNRLNEDTIWLEWRERDSDYPFRAHQLSDGTLRFMVLTTLLLQPNPPAIIVIDEPELGLHPFAIEKLAGLLRSASSRTQLIVATQSPQLISALEPEDVIVADRENGETTLRRLDAESLEGWLEEYTLGELWQKNILGGVVNPNVVRSRSNS